MQQSLKRISKSRTGVVYLMLPVVFIFGIFVGNSSSISLGLSNRKANVDYTTVDEVYGVLKANYDGSLDDQALLDGLKKGLAQATGDPYTEYFTAEESKEFNQQLSGTFTGIGAELGKQDNAIVIVAPIRGFPAEKAGIKAKDVLLQINGEDALSLTLSDAVKKIRGPKGTEVTLTILRDGERKEFKIVRDDIKVPSVEYSVIDDNVGYIVVSRFSDDTNSLITEAARDFRSKQVNSVILDLRNNPGGLLEQSIQVASHWVDQGKTVVSEKRGDALVRNKVAARGQEFKDFKTVVLINEGSASASEIVAGALKDYGLATLVGEKSYGKGSVQEIDELSGGASLKVTIARWFTPNNRNIDKEGIEPDHVIKITPEQAQSDIDAQKDKALELVKL